MGERRLPRTALLIPRPTWELPCALTANLRPNNVTTHNAHRRSIVFHHRRSFSRHHSRPSLPTPTALPLSVTSHFTSHCAPTPSSLYTPTGPRRPLSRHCPRRGPLFALRQPTPLFTSFFLSPAIPCAPRIPLLPTQRPRGRRHRLRLCSAPHRHLRRRLITDASQELAF
jgi:hypothetical protein